MATNAAPRMTWICASLSALVTVVHPKVARSKILEQRIFGTVVSHCDLQPKPLVESHAHDVLHRLRLNLHSHGWICAPHPG